MTGTRLWTTLHRLSLVCLLSLLLTMAMAGPVRNHKSKHLTCSRHCRVPQERRFKYENDQVYEYSYKVEVTTQLTSGPHTSVRLLVEAVASVHVLNTCDMLLKLREVTIMESDPERHLQKADNSRQFREELEKVALRFAFLDGRVSDVCPADTETTWALNVKRGFLSAFQNSMENFDTDQSVEETDVMGTCRSVYRTSGSGWFSNIIKKSRDLANCTSSSSSSSSGGGDQHSASFVTPQMQSQSKFLRPFLSGQQDCEQTIDWNGILTSALCVEQRHFRPLAGETTGSVTKVSQMVKFLQKRDRRHFSPPVFKRTSLQYDPTTHVSEDDSAIHNEGASQRRAKTILRQLCLPSEILPETPDHFYELVANIRQLSARSLRELLEKVSGQSLCSDHLRLKKIFLDALAMAGTEPALRLLVKALAARDQEEPIRAHFLLSTLPFLPFVTSPMLQAIRPLLDHGRLSEKALLPVSSLVHRYCQSLQQHGGQCDTDVEVQRLLVYFKRAVGPKCHARGQNVHKVLLGLRAIGNAGQAKRMTEVLNTCLKMKNNPLDVRVTAVEAFRRMPCDDSRERALHIFEDTSEHTELRIASYLTMMQCATTSSHFLRLQRTLAREANTQVVSFVFTHLTNLKETSTQFREDAQGVLDNVDFASKDLGRLQLSRNLAGPVWSDRMKMVSNLIWPLHDPSSSSSAWLPRSLSANLTLNLLGRAVDLAEVGVRGEGLEVMLAEVLMPMMGLRKPSMGPKTRQDKLNRLKASVYARVLGNELFHYQFSGSGNVIQQLTSGKMFDLKALMSKMAAEGKVSYSQSLILMDQQLTMPTSSGLLLTVTLNSSVAGQLTVVGGVDFSQAFSKPRSLHVDGAIKPSAALRVSGSMTVDAIVTRAAVRMSGSVHTNTILKGRAQIEKGRMVNVELDMPRNNMTVFDARTEMAFLLGKNVHTLTLTPDERHDLEVCTGPGGVSLTGLDLCGKLEVAKSPMSSESVHRSEVLTRPSSVSLMLYKRDTLSQIRLFAQHLMTKNSLITQLNFSSPGSNMDRTLDFCVDANLKKSRMQLRLITPWKKFELAGFITSKPKKKEAQLSLTVDQRVTSSLKVSMTIRKDKLGVTFNPLLEVRDVHWVSDRDPLTLSGLLHLGRFGRSASTEVELKGVPGYRPSFKGSLTNSNKEMSMKGLVRLSHENTYSISLGTFIATAPGKQSAKVEVTPFFFLNAHSRQLVSLSGRGDYRQGRTIRADLKLATTWTRPMAFTYSMSRAQARNQIHYRCDAEFKSAVARVALDARADVRHRQMVWTRMTVSHDIPDLLLRDTVSMVTKLATQRKDNQWSGLAQSSLKSKAYSQHNFEVKLNGELQPTNSHVKVYCGQGAGPSKRHVALTSKMRHDLRSIGHVSLAVRATADILSEGVNVELKASHRHSGQGLESKLAIDYGDDQQTKAHFTLINKSTDYLVLVGTAILFLPQTPEEVSRRERKRKSRKAPPDFHMKMKVVEGETDYDITAGVKTERKKRDFFIRSTVKKPVSFQRVYMTCRSSTNSKIYQDFEAEFSHTVHPLLADVVELVFAKEWTELDLVKPLRLLTSVSGAEILQKDLELREAEYDDLNFESNKSAYDAVKLDSLYTELHNMKSNEEHNENDMKMNIKGGIDVKSTFGELISGSWNLAHTYEGPWHKTEVTLANNDDNYACEMSVRDNVAKWLENSGGKVTVSKPRKTITAEWSHEYDGSKIISTYLASWSKRRQILINLSGRLSRGNQTETVFGDFLMKIPWKPVEDLRASIAHDSGPGLLRSKSTFRLNDVLRASHQVTFGHTSMFTDAGVLVVSPWTKKVTGSVVVQHGFYPMTTTAEFMWSSRHHLSVTGSADLEVWDNAQLSLNIKTTVFTLRNIFVEASNKMLEENLVSEIKAQYGNRHAFSVENVLRRRDWGKMQLRVLSPLEMFRVLETGYVIEGSRRNLSAHADFRIYPLIRKIESSLVWVYDTKFAGKFRLSTPLQEFPFLQIVTTSERKDSYRYSSIILKCHPSEVYAVNSKYTLDSLEEIIVSIDTPHRSFDSVSVEFHQKNNASLKDVSLKISLPQGQKIVAEGHIHMERGARGSFTITTPYPGFETCEAAFLYSFHGTEFSLAGNLTTEKRSVLSHCVWLYGNSTDMFTQPAGSNVNSVGGLIQMNNRLRPLQRFDFGLQTATASQLSDGKSEDLKLQLLYDQHTHRLVQTFQFDLALADKAKVFSNFTQDSRETVVAVSAGYGKDYWISSNASISQVDSESATMYTPSSTETPKHSEDSILQKESLVPGVPASAMLDTVDCVSLNLEVHAASLRYDRFGFLTRFHRGLQHARTIPALQENPDEDTPALVPALMTRVVGWAGHSQNSSHAAFFNVSHKTRSDLFETNIEIQTALHKEDNVSFRFHSYGVPVDYSGNMQFAINDRHVFRTSVKQTHKAHELYSAVSWKKDHVDNITLVFSCGRSEDKLTVDISALCNSTVGVYGRYTDRFEDEDRRKLSIDFGLDSSEAGTITSSTNVTFSESEPLRDFGIFTNSTVQNNHANLSLEVNKQGSLHFSGRLLQPSTTTGLPQELTEIDFLYKGDPSKFTSVICFNYSVPNRPVHMRMEIDYASMFDMDTNMIVKSPFPYVTDLKLAVKSSGNGQGDRRAMATVGWAPYRQITMDIDHKRVSSLLRVTRQTDVVVVTPFQSFQNGLVRVRQSKMLTKMDRSLSAKVNGQSVLGVAVSSTDPAALGIRQPLLAWFQKSAAVPEKPSHHVNVFIHWNLTNPNSKLYVFTEYKTSAEGDQVQFKQLTVNVTHPWKRLNATYLSRNAPDEMSGEGKLTWDASPEANKKIDYLYSFSNRTTSSARAYRGLFKLGTPLRSVAANGSWTDRNRVNAGSGIVGRFGSHAMDGVFYWDADGDRQKQLALRTSVTSGDVSSADIAVTIPMLSQTFRLKSDLAFRIRDVLWNSTTSVSYSQDPSKTVTFTSALLLHSSSPEEGMNYTLTTFLTQPSSSLDLGVSSRAVSSRSEVSGSFGGWFVSTEGTMEKLLLTGAYNRPGRSLDMMMKTPTRNASLTAELFSGQTYELRVLGSTHHAKESAKKRQLGLHVSLDPFHRSLLVKVNHDADSAKNYVAAKAWFVNASAIRAEVYRPLVTGSVTDSAFSVNLDESHTVLHVNLSWRPQLAQDLQVLSRSALIQLGEYHVQATQALVKASHTVHYQLSQKWENASTRAGEDLQPAVDFLLSELALLQDELKNRVLKNLEDLLKDVRDNQHVAELVARMLDDFGETVRKSVVLTKSTHAYQRALEAGERWLDSLLHSHMAYRSSEVLYQLPLTLAMAREQGQERVEEALYYMDLYLLLVKHRLEKFGNAVYSLEEWDLDAVRGTMGDMLSVWGVVRTMGARAELWLAPLSNTTSYVAIVGMAREVYRQGTWLCYYLDLDTNLEDRVENIVHNLAHIIMAELRFHTRHFRFLQKNRFTLWEPKYGKIQAEVRLPFPVKSLWAWLQFAHNRMWVQS